MRTQRDRASRLNCKAGFSTVPFRLPSLVLALCLAVLLTLTLLGAWSNAKETKPQLQEWQMRGIEAALEDERSGVKAKALWRLAGHKSQDLNRLAKPDTLQKIAKLLQDPTQNSYVRGSAAQALSNFGEFAKTYIPDIAKLLQDPKEDSDVRVSAAAALSNFGEFAKAYIPDIAKLLQDPQQDSSVRVSAAVALGNFGEAAKAYIPEILQFIQDPKQDASVRRIAANGLSRFGEAAKPYIPEIAKLLQDPKQDAFIRGSVAYGLSNFGEAAKPYIPEIAKLLQDPKQDAYVRGSAAYGLSNFGEAARPYIPEIFKLIQDPKQDASVRSSAADVLSKFGAAAKAYIPDILQFIQDPQQDAYVRNSAAEALGNFGEAAKPYIPEIAKLFQDPKQDAFIRRSAAFALSNFGEAAKPYIPDILQFIQDPQQGLDVRRIAANGLSKFGEAAKPYIPEIAKLFQDPKQDAFIRRSAAFALSDFGEVAKPHIPDILKLIQDPEQDSFVRLSAADVLSRFGEAAKPYIPDILKLIQDPKQDSSVRLSAADVLGELDKLSVENVVAVLSPTYEEKSEVDRWRFHAYFLSGGDEDVKRLLKWIAKPQQLPEKLEHDEGVKTLEASKKAWDAAKDYPELRDDLADKIALIARKVTWKPADLVLLKQHQDSLKTSHPANANTVQAVIVPLEGWQSLFSARNLILAHAAFWFALIFFYPKSPQIQAIFFWNPWMRNILGFPYVTFLLTWVPFLRHKLFEPFRLPLLADAGLDHFQPDRYFPYFDVIPKGSDEIQPLTQALPRIQGQVILEGESGLGKTMFLRQLLQRSRRISVYLPATKCSEGVIEAIQQKLHGDEIKDPKFLQSLIYSGAIDICIDGLNEVNPNTLAKITQFVENHAKANILLTTQPLEWTPPGMAKTYVLQPLQPDQIERYLISRQPLLAKTAPIHGPAYEQACRRFLEQTIGRQSRLSPEEQKTAQAILSNPMELSIAAALIAANTEPNLFNLREQQYTLMAADFQRLHNRPFPLKKFSEAIYQRWLTDQKTLPAADFYDEICCMEDEQFRMVVSRQPQTVKGEAQKDWYFRHDKIAEFFLVQTFLGDSDTAKSRLTQHLSDTPFRGVYFLLATLLPLDAAQQLREDLIQHAADTKDHTVSDTFIQLLRSR